MNHLYYDFSSVFFYTNRTALLLNGRFNNLVYGSYAPTAAPVIIDDAQFLHLWGEPERCYLVVDRPHLGRIRSLKTEGSAGPLDLDLVRASGGKFLFTNHPLGRHNAATNAHE